MLYITINQNGMLKSAKLEFYNHTSLGGIETMKNIILIIWAK